MTLQLFFNIVVTFWRSLASHVSFRENSVKWPWNNCNTLAQFSPEKNSKIKKKSGKNCANFAGIICKLGDKIQTREFFGESWTYKIFGSHEKVAAPTGLNVQVVCMLVNSYVVLGNVPNVKWSHKFLSVLSLHNSLGMVCRKNIAFQMKLWSSTRRNLARSLFLVYSISSFFWVMFCMYY